MNYPDGVTTYDIDYHNAPIPECDIHGQALDEDGRCSICDNPRKARYWEVCERVIKIARDCGNKTTADYWYKKQGAAYEM